MYMSTLLLTAVDTFTWEAVPEFPTDDEEACPCPRAGHSAAVVGTRMYVWSGRDGYRRVWNNQVWVCVRVYLFNLHTSGNSHQA